MQEYEAMYDLPVVVNRCGVIAGPWQLGRVDQGFVALWAARHCYGGPLQYRGFGGEGLQVRDVLHVDDLYDLVLLQLRRIEDHRGKLYVLGGGHDRSVSLRELSNLCAEMTGNRIEIGSDPETHPSDIPYHVTDNREVTEKTGWKPRRSLEVTLRDVLQWLDQHRTALERLFA
jgi:CDP-paratose 2-epimerase